MPTTHTIAQGETLTRIAQRYKLSSWKTLYDHPDNAAFRKLRPNPNIIFPGDTITVPDVVAKKMSASAGKSHVFCLKKEVEIFKIKISNSAGKAWDGKRVVVTLGANTIDTLITPEGMLEIPLTQGDESEAKIDIYMDDPNGAPSHTFNVELAHLDPVEELSGVQARCNLLGHDCGVADGIMGSKTRAGVKSFQSQYGLQVDGEPGPLTKAKLKEVYGS